MEGSNGRTPRRVAVTGVGVVSPIGTGVDAFWDCLLAGRSGIGRIRRFDTEGQRVHIAGEVDDFEAKDWMLAKDVKRVDRFCHLSQAAAQLAIDDAEFVPDEPTRVGTVFSSAVAGIIGHSDEVRKMQVRGPRGVSPYTIPALIGNMAGGTIAMRFGFGGPCICPVSACASSADATGLAFRLVRDGYADACLAGGGDAPVSDFVVAAFANLRALSTRNDDPAGASRPFDAERDGFVLAEGAAALMLEPLHRAEARGAKVYAEVCGYGVSSDAYHPTAPDPGGAGAARAIVAALEDADLPPDSVGYINAHGTSTPMSDAGETRAVRRALGDHADRVAISSTKSMTGHLLGAAGAIESAACVLTIRDGRIPPTINYRTPDPECDLDYVPNEARSADVDVALCNAMGFGGHNVVVAFRRP